MTGVFQKYFKDLYKDFPIDLYEILLYILCIGVLLFLITKGIRKGWRLVSGLMLVEYVILLFFTTVFSRYYRETPKFSLTPFWSYMEIINGKHELIPEIIMNVAVFVPIGLFLGLTFRDLKWKGVLVVAVCISLSIEILQFILQRGFSELDDVMHNTIGCLLGYVAYKLARYGFKKIAYTKIIS